MLDDAINDVVPMTSEELTKQAINTYRNALESHSDEACARAFALAQKADKDNAEIQYIIGQCYRWGDGVEEDSQKAMQWYRKAAERGNVDALLGIGDLYAEYITDPYYEGFDETSSDDFIKWLSMALKCESSLARIEFAKAYVRGVYRCHHPELELKSRVNKATDFELIRIAANGGYSEAQYQYGLRCESGDGVPQDYAEAAKWFRKAAEQSTTDCYARKLGDLYKKGLGVTKNYDEAIKWYCKAVESVNNGQNVINLAEAYELAGKYTEAVKWYRELAGRGMAEAQCRLGVMCAKGLGIPKDDTEACKWYLKAAEQGHVNAQHDLGGHYYLGKGVVQDYAAAAKWLRMSAEQGNADAQRVLGVMHMEGHGFEKNYEEAIVWFQKAAEQGLPVAYFDLAGMYELGNGVSKDIKKAVELYLKSAELGDNTAQCAIAYMYETGQTPLTKEKCVDVNYCERAYWYLKAAINGNGNAQVIMGDCFAIGIGVAKDDVEAAKWYRKAAEKGIVRAQYTLGLILGIGKGVPKNDKEAARWFQRAAEQGYADAQYTLGGVYESGKGVSKDGEKALYWYRKAAERGNEEAGKRLKKILADKGCFEVGTESKIDNMTCVDTEGIAMKKLTDKDYKLVGEIAMRAIKAHGLKDIISQQENPFLLSLYVPIAADKRKVVAMANEIFHGLGVLPAKRSLDMGECDDYCSLFIVGEGDYYAVLFNHPKAMLFKEDEEGYQYTIKYSNERQEAVGEAEEAEIQSLIDGIKTGQLKSKTTDNYLMLAGVPYDEIEAGRKTVEYRDFTKYILTRTIGIKTIRFNRGTVKNAPQMKWEVKKVVLMDYDGNECDPFNVPESFWPTTVAIHLGRRLG